MDSITPEEFGNSLKEIRLRKHFSLRQVSQQSKTDGKPAISPSYWSLVERGERNIPKVDTLVRMAKGLRITREEILNLAGLSSANNSINSQSSDNKKHYYDLTEKDEKSIDKELEDMMNGLDSKHSLSFFQNGQDLSDQDKELLKASMRQTLELSKQLAKRKFTPKKYRNGEE